MGMQLLILEFSINPDRFSTTANNFLNLGLAD